MSVIYQITNKTMYTTLETSQKLKEWGVEFDYEIKYYFCTVDENILMLTKKEWEDIDYLNYKKIDFPSYDLTKIITNGEMAKKFFGKERRKIIQLTFSCEKCLEDYRKESNICGIEYHTTKMKNYLLEDNQKKAEKCLLANCVFNPLNK